MPLEVVTQKNFVAEFIRFNLNFIHNNDKFDFRATVWGVRDNMRTSSIACWIARGRFPIRLQKERKIGSKLSAKKILHGIVFAAHRAWYVLWHEAEI